MDSEVRVSNARLLTGILIHFRANQALIVKSLQGSFVAGASRLSYRKFAMHDAIGAGLWTVGFVTLGYVLGASWRVAEKWIGRTGFIVAGVIVLVLAVSWIRRRRAQPRTG